MKAIVTGGASGIGAAIVARLRAENVDVEVLDLRHGFDVGEADHWEAVGAVDVACLNAGVLGGVADPSAVSLERYRQAMRVNVDGVVLGVRRLAHVMPSGGRIVVTASLAGLTAMPDDPVYAATKHAVVGFVRSAAPALAVRGITINAICPGIADTPMLSDTARERLETAAFPLILRGRRRRSRLVGAQLATHGPRVGRATRPAPARLQVRERSRPEDSLGRLGHSPASRRRLGPAKHLASRPTRTAIPRRRRSASGSAVRRPSDAPRRDRRRSGPLGPGAPSARAASRR